MPTSIHIPADLIHRVDQKAKDQGISRNRFIVEILRQAVECDENWSKQFQHTFSGKKIEQELSSSVDEMMKHIEISHQSKGKPPF